MGVAQKKKKKEKKKKKKKKNKQKKSQHTTIDKRVKNPTVSKNKNKKIYTKEFPLWLKGNEPD